MTEIEKQAMALANEVFRERGHGEWINCSRRYEALTEAICRAIEQHEAFRQEVSKIVSDWWYGETPPLPFRRFIIAKPDPLVEAWLESFPGNHIDDAREECAKISAALAARGLEIREVSHD